MSSEYLNVSALGQKKEGCIPKFGHGHKYILLSQVTSPRQDTLFNSGGRGDGTVAATPTPPYTVTSSTMWMIYLYTYQACQK